MLDSSQPVSTRQAAPIHGALWTWYRRNNGPYYVLSNDQNLGCPIKPEEYINPHNFDVLQETSNGYLYWNEWYVVAVTPEEFITGTLTGGIPFTIALTSSFVAYPLSSHLRFATVGRQP